MAFPTLVRKGLQLLALGVIVLLGCVCVCVCVCVCRREMWESVLPESLSAIFIVVCLFVSLFLPFRGIIPLFDMRFVPELQLLCVKIFLQRTKEN